MTQKKKIKISIVDDHSLFRRGLIKLVSSLNHKKYEFEVLFDAGNGEEFIKKMKGNELPDIVIIDIEMPGMNGYEIVDWLRQHYPNIKILIVSMVEHEGAIVRMLKLGVNGYLSKDIEPSDLEAAIIQIIEKGYYYTDFITGKLIYSLQNKDGELSPTETAEILLDQFNARERELLKLMCTEMTYEEIANKMFLSIKTIEYYRNSLFEKLEVKNRVGLVLAAIKKELVKI